MRVARTLFPDGLGLKMARTSPNVLKMRPGNGILEVDVFLSRAAVSTSQPVKPGAQTAHRQTQSSACKPAGGEPGEGKEGEEEARAKEKGKENTTNAIVEAYEHRRPTVVQASRGGA